ARKRDVSRADHDGQEKIPERAWDRRDEEQPDHDHAVQREEAVVGHRAHERSARVKELEAEKERKYTAKKQRDRIRDKKEHADPLVIRSEKPGTNARTVVKVVGVRAHRSIPSWPCGGAECV